MSYSIHPVTKDSAIDLWNKSNPDNKLDDDYRTGGKFDDWYALSTWLIRRDNETKEVVGISAYELKDGYMTTGALYGREGLNTGKEFFNWRRKKHKGIPQIAGFRHQDREQQQAYVESRVKRGYDMSPSEEEWPEIPDEIRTQFNQEYGNDWGIKKKLTWWNILQTW